MARKAGARDVLPRIRREIIKALEQVDELPDNSVADRLQEAFIENPIGFLQAVARFMPQEVQQHIEGQVLLIANVGNTQQPLPVPNSTKTIASSEDCSVL